MAQTREWAVLLPEALRPVILKEARGQHAGEILIAARGSCDRLVSHLERLIGNAGAHALLQRSITLTRRQHPWLADALSSSGEPVLPARLDHPEQQDAAVVMQSSLALLVTLVNLLVDFIGERLTIQVLSQVWPDVAPQLVRPKEPS